MAAAGDASPGSSPCISVPLVIVRRSGADGETSHGPARGGYVTTHRSRHHAPGTEEGWHDEQLRSPFSESELRRATGAAAAHHHTSQLQRSPPSSFADAGSPAHTMEKQSACHTGGTPPGWRERGERGLRLWSRSQPHHLKLCGNTPDLRATPRA